MSRAYSSWKTYIDTPKQAYLVWDGERTNESLRWLVPGTSMVIAGHTNHGKTSLMMSMIAGLLRNNPELMVVDFTIDDPATKRYTQYVSILGNLPINSVLNHKVAINSEKDIQGLALANQMMESWDRDERLVIFEAMTREGDSFVDQNKASFIIKTVEGFRQKYPDRKLIFLIDAINDVEYDLGHTFGELDQEKALCRDLQKLAIGTESIMMANVHIRKNMLKRPTLEDIKGNSYTAYRATVALAAYSDAKAQGLHKSKIVWSDIGANGVETDRPVLEVWFLKSKVDDCKYPVVAYRQWPHKGRAVEIVGTEESDGRTASRQDAFVNLIYGEAK